MYILVFNISTACPMKEKTTIIINGIGDLCNRRPVVTNPFGSFRDIFSPFQVKVFGWQYVLPTRLEGYGRMLCSLLRLMAGDDFERCSVRIQLFSFNVHAFGCTRATLLSSAGAQKKRLGVLISSTPCNPSSRTPFLDLLLCYHTFKTFPRMK